MEFQGYNNSANQTPPNQVPPQPVPPVFYTEKKKKGGLMGFFRGIFMGISVLIKIFFILVFIGIIGFFVSDKKDDLMEDIVRQGPEDAKIAIVNLEDTIYDEQADSIYKQLAAAQNSEFVKAVILRVNSPGGTVSASDRIYHDIMNFRNKTHKPVIAFMQGTAASGGYYASVACEKIIAEPTTITGSIGVISSYLVLQNLLEDKLGVQPVVIKSGEKKDWPSNYRAPSEEEIQYIHDKLIKPTLDIFVNVVAKGRESVLSLEEVKELADGSIFGAQEALEKKLIDDIGYLDDAINMAKSIAGINEAQVIQYKRPFSFGGIMGVESKQNLLNLDRNTLFELGTPQVMYLWNAY